MRISDLFKQPNISSVSANPDQRPQRSAADSAEQRPGEDRISISPLARQFAQISQILSEDEEARRARIEELRKGIDAGTYSVPSKDVVASMVRFARDEEF